MPLAEFQQANLQACMRQRGCPLCRATWNMDTARFGWYVNDGVLDEETRRQVVRAAGFCTPHVLALAIIEGSDFLWSHLGSCMVSADVIDHAFLPRLQKFLTRSHQWLLPLLRQKSFSSHHPIFHEDRCPLCFDHRQHETTYLERFVQAFCADGDFRQAYLQATDSLCLPHFQHIRRSLPEQGITQQLDAAEAHALEQCEQATTRISRDQLRRRLSLLYGADTFLWSDGSPRAALDASQVNPPACLACREREGETAQAIAGLFDQLEETAQFGEGSASAGLALCFWHAWWVFNHSASQPAIRPRLASILQRTSTGVQSRLGNADREYRPCQVCRWTSEQEITYAGRVQRQLRDPEQYAQLCLPHAQAALRHAGDEETMQHVTLALIYSASLLVRRLEAYIHKCTERFQHQMQPDELVAWFDAIRWFGGSDAAQFLLTSSSTLETTEK